NNTLVSRKQSGLIELSSVPDLCAHVALCVVDQFKQNFSGGDISLGTGEFTVVNFITGRLVIALRPVEGSEDGAVRGILDREIRLWRCRLFRLHPQPLLDREVACA